MKKMYVYILSNLSKTTIYVGVTNNLQRRIQEHFEARGNPKTFAGRCYCNHLVYYEEFDRPMPAIRREKEIKKWRREKKNALIESVNPNWDFWEHNI